MRMPVLRARGTVIAAFVIAGLVIPAPVFAQEGPRPVLDSAPPRVQYQGTATVNGHFENGSGDERITLQRQRPDGWDDIESKQVDQDGQVSFTLEGLTKSDEYRLNWASGNGENTPSDQARIEVAPQIKLNVSSHDVMSGRSVRLRGTFEPAAQGREVVLEQRIDGSWRSITRRSVADGTFGYELTVNSKGYRPLRAVFEGDADNASGDDQNFVRVYARSPATWYGPGFYGDRTACGERLRRGTLGVAHRSLPCGTKVSLLHKGRTITVKVIDRGPYGEADWDLTEETAERLHFQGSKSIGVTR
jgi:rare lipoprotein A